MAHSLIPERMLVVSPSLAATIGLEEAILLQALSDGARISSDPKWSSIDKHTLRSWLPFWPDLEIKRILKSLTDKGIVQFSSPPFPQTDQLIFSFDSNAKVHSKPHEAYKSSQAQHKSPIAGRWQPDHETLRYIHETLGIAKQFALNQIQEFVLHHQSQGTLAASWATMFIRFVKKRHESIQTNMPSSAQAAQSPAPSTNQSPSIAGSTQPSRLSGQLQNSGTTDAIFNQDRQRKSVMTRQWQPDQDTTEILTRAGVEPNFVQDCISEFILYWREKGDAHDTWNTKFVAWVRRQWARFSASIAHPSDPVPMADGWQPAEDVYEILAMANIDRAFAQSLVQEFVLYWRDSNQLHTSWNSKFLQHAKHMWSKRLNGQTSQRDHAANTSVAERLSDTSWAN